MAITVWHSIRHNRNHMLHAEFTALSFIELDLIPIKVLHCGNNEFCPFVPVTLTLTRRSSYTTLTRIPLRYIHRPKINFLRHDSQKLSYYRPKYTQTDRQTDGCHRKHYHAATWVVTDVVFCVSAQPTLFNMTLLQRLAPRTCPQKPRIWNVACKHRQYSCWRWS